ncbi:DUF485 domain-containing protein [Alcaligenes endophyticus]|uniref:DUF485 domain-containing protein n=1 Tax=Alcaligenes endophyticus TaxID=1929088 RepID=A0ABT8EGK9_9BURK|nr:DUF485 domain-containing protein [Alcaligenes endophyticus]MCX5589911.1 DUF485 domain-containing protein [Alcaligenes endophyticus]MDN4120426.1 DUF485 domain-containing protein [Alcaligenes endophyticus]
MDSSQDVVSAVMQHPAYQELLRRRNRLSLLFFVIAICIYAGFILTLAFDPVLFGQPLGDLTMSIGIFCATLVVFSAVIMIAIYVWISNKVFDPLLAQIIKDIK